MLRSVVCQRLWGAIETSNVGVTNAGGALQLVRWRRKPRWLPIAKSKMFRVPERKKEDPIERAELMRLHANYKTQLRAVRAYLIKETKEHEATSTSDHLIISPEEMEEEFRRCVELNDQWNKDIAVVREQRLAQERVEKRELILQRLDAKEERLASKRQSIEALVRIEKERSKTFITVANIDQAIEQALADKKDYNFAIDLSGKIYRGSDSQASPDVK